MGKYINPGDTAFRQIAGSNYVDKTGLIELINRQINGPDNLICISRPRRFGKSYAAKMLTAYYDCTSEGADDLFEGRAISKTEDYRRYRNQFSVLHLDISGFTSEAIKNGVSLREVPIMIENAVWRDLENLGYGKQENESLNDGLERFVEANQGRKFIFIIDEWDAVIREAKEDEEAQRRFLSLLRGWFRNSNFAPKVIAAAYMTGILPIKKDGSQTAVSDFKEFTILDPGDYVPYTGFTESEVKTLCGQTGMRFEELKRWYDGYDFSGSEAIYNPYSVMEAIERKKCRSYWGKSSASETLTTYVDMDFEGLQETIARLIAGEEVPVYTDDFQNDFDRFETKDDILTLLIHLGYLTYDIDAGLVRIPNEEVRNEFNRILRRKNNTQHWVRLIQRSEKLLQDTLEGNSPAVANTIEEIRQEQYAPQFYNNEQAMRAIIKYAFFAAIPYYSKLEEVPSGKGIADVIFIPESASYPALVVELKWNESAEKGIGQIESKAYTKVLQNYAGRILLVAINYDPVTKSHTCEIKKA